MFCFAEESTEDLRYQTLTKGNWNNYIYPKHKIDYKIIDINYDY